MRTAGIICECNPLHAGHQYLMEQARRAGAEGIVCVMSGCFTQRGEPAVLNPRSRAELLLSAGADAVLELPYPYSCAGAERFAAAGVRILDRLGVDTLWFGSECGDIGLLRRAARIASGEVFAQMYRERCAGGSRGTAAAYFDCLREQGGLGDRFSPNDILGIAYLRALARLHSRMEPFTVLRAGSGYHEETPREGEFPSATALRRLLFSGGADALSPWMPEEQLRVVRRELDAGSAPARMELAERALLASLRLMPPERLEQAPELTGGLGRRVRAAAHRAGSLAELLSLSVTKKYPEARVRRGILFALTGVRPEDIRSEPAYAVLLAANQTGCRFLKEARRSAAIPVVTAHAGIPQTPRAKRQEELTQTAFALYTLCLPSPHPSDAFLHCSSLIRKTE